MTSDPDTNYVHPECCSECGVNVGRFPNQMPFHANSDGRVDVMLDSLHTPLPIPAPAPDPDPLYRALHQGLDVALRQEEYGMASELCRLLEQVTRKINRRELRRQRAARDVP